MGETYEEAVVRAGVIELPDDAIPPPDRLSKMLSGRFEDDNPPGAPR